MKRRLVYAALLVGACGAVAALPMSGPHRKGEAALAIRDQVPGYQQFFTERYTVPRLEAAYEASWYFTEDVRGFSRALDEATTKYEHVDLYLLAHYNRYIEQVAQLPAEKRARIRLVYDTGGGSSANGPRWLSLGVGHFVGHPGGNLAPAFYVYFLPEWLHSQDLKKAVDEANAQTHDLLQGPVGAVAGRYADVDALWAGTEARVFDQTPR